MAQKIQRKPQIDQTMKKIFKSNFQPKYGYFGKTMCTVVAIQGDFRPKKKKNFFFGSDCRTPESDSRTPESVCRTPESDRRTPESVCRTQGVRLSDSGGKSVIYTLQARQTAPCEYGILRHRCMIVSVACTRVQCFLPFLPNPTSTNRDTDKKKTQPVHEQRRYPSVKG